MPRANKQYRSETGFTTTELLVVVLVALIIAALGLPNLASALHTARLRGTDTNVSNVVQTARWRAVQDDRFYSVRFLAPGPKLFEAYVDIYPQNVNGSSGNGAAGPIDPQDPQAVISSEVTQQAAGNAPNTANLQNQILPAGSPLVPLDGSNIATAVSFGPRGLPCLPTGTNGGTVCNSAGGPQAYWLFFQDSVTLAWGAVTVTPAGRIQTWYFATKAGNWVPTQM